MYVVYKSFVQRVETSIPSKFENDEDISSVFLFFLSSEMLFLATARYDVRSLKLHKSRARQMQQMAT